MTGNDRQHEGTSVDPITMMMEMKREFENMKQKNAREIKALKVENLLMKKSLEIGQTPLIEGNTAYPKTKLRHTWKEKIVLDPIILAIRLLEQL